MRAHGLAAWTCLCLLIGTGVSAAQTIRPTLAPQAPILDDPNFAAEEYAFIVAGEHLQGMPATVKWGAVAFWTPPSPSPFASLRTGVVVTNPSNVATANVTINYRDQAGTIVGQQVVTIAPEGSFRQAANALLAAGSSSPGLGSVEVRSSQPVVGSTVHVTTQFPASGGWSSSVGLNFDDPDAIPAGPFATPAPGASSLQQLQAPNAPTSALLWGPIPFTNSQPIDLLNGLTPFWGCVNPNPTATTITITRYVNPLAVLSTQTVTLPPFGSFVDTNLWSAFLANSFQFDQVNMVSYDLDLSILVSSSSGSALIGEAYLVDLFGGTGGPAPALTPETRFRMTSMMMATSPASTLINPDLTNTSMLTTVMGLQNGSSSATAAINVSYYDRNGTLLATDNIPPLLAGASVRIGPGLPASPNYPLAGLGSSVFSGWVEVKTADLANQLIGWSGREVLANTTLNNSLNAQFFKAWGESLSGANGLEPGQSGTIYTEPIPTRFLPNGRFLRKTAPIVTTDVNGPVFPGFLRPYEPGFTNYLNLSLNSYSQYYYRYFAPAGGADVTNYAPQPFSGLPLFNTSFTYEDNDPPALTILTGALSENVDLQEPVGPLDTQSWEGVHTIGNIAALGIPGVNPTGEGEEEPPPPPCEPPCDPPKDG